MPIDWEDIKEASVLYGFGNEIPSRFRSIVERYMKFKSVFIPEPFTTSDLAACAMMYLSSIHVKNKNG